MKFRLKVQQIDRACIFDLTWGRSQTLNATIPYPETLPAAYQNWQRAYLTFYQTALRGRVADAGILNAPPFDWHAALLQAEAKLFQEFHQWLRGGELYELRSKLTQTPETKIFLTCQPLDLARLPWEAWELATRHSFPIFRVPPLLQETAILPHPPPPRRQMRVLAIFGDETNLDFQSDREGIKTLNQLAEVVSQPWRPGESPQQTQQRILNAIADPRGWDILFFAGHGDETELTGGELGIAPGASMQLSELLPALETARQRGLQFALFNCCNGLSLANTLIDRGFGQVAILREPIHNRVARAFLLPFLQELIAGKDVGKALRHAVQCLKQNREHPSAYLIPSLFRHPDTELFRLQPTGWRQNLRACRPSYPQAIAIVAIAALSCSLSVQGWLLDRRVRVQAMYRHLTGQTAPQAPSVTLIQIDDRSLRQAGIADPKPIDRQYLAEIADRILPPDPDREGLDRILPPDPDREGLGQTLPPYQEGLDRILPPYQGGLGGIKVLGFDYLLDRADRRTEKGQKGDRALSRTLAEAHRQGIHLVFASRYHNSELLGIAPTLNACQCAIDGDMQLLGPPIRYMPLVDPQSTAPFPLAYTLVATSLTNPEAIASRFPPRLQEGSLTLWGYKLQQMWLHPIVDFSIPPRHIYTRIPAWQLFESEELPDALRKSKIVLIAPGGYDEAGIQTEGEDNFPIPPALAYWRDRSGDRRNALTGGEVHAYLIHHFHHQHFAIAVPDLLGVFAAVLISRGLTLKMRSRKRILVTCTLGILLYGAIALQLYISARLLLPWFFPALTLIGLSSNDKSA